MNSISTLSRPPVTAFKGAFTQRPISTSLGNRTALGSRAGISTSSGRSGSANEGRPMTSVTGAGYNGKSFDPLNLNKSNFADSADKTEELTPEAKSKSMEKAVMKLLEESAKASVDGNQILALEKAKDANKADKNLNKFQEVNELTEQCNADQSFAVSLNLANIYFQNALCDDALNLFQSMLKGKQFPQSAKIRVNMGNMYYQQRKFPMAVKMYRMAIDQVPTTHKSMRGKLKRNIASCFVQLGQYQDAIDNYEDAMLVSADVQTAFNLMVCLFAKGDKDKMRRHFSKMMTMPVPELVGEDSTDVEDTCDDTDKHDHLKEYITTKRAYFDEKLLQAARLIAPAIGDEDDWVSGYKWLLDQLRTENEAVMSKLELDMAIQFMRKGQYERAIDTLKSFEKKDAGLRAMASINLSFLYFLEGDYTLAERHADIAIKSDRYNAKGLVNKGNCLFMAQDYAQAKEFYLEAVGVEADCLEAMFNLGLVNEKLGSLQEAYGAFDKLHTILPTVHEAIYNVGGIFEKSEERSDLEQAVKTYESLADRLPQDAPLCTKIAQLYERLQDEESACHWQKESHRRDANQLDVISWLGVW